MTATLETLCAWSEPKEVQTKLGPRLLRKAPATEEFWQAWRADKAALKEAGLSCAPKDRDDPDGGWEALWWLPLDAERMLAEQARQRAEEAERERARLNLPAELDAEYETRYQDVRPRLLSYQGASARRLARALLDHGGALDASDTGTGKTFVALAACAVLGRRAFVVCPKSVIPSWRRAAQHMGVRLEGVGNYEMLRTGKTPAVKIKLAEKKGGKDQFEWQANRETVLIFDECHRMKDRTTLNCRMGLAALCQGYKVLGLSATAADNPMQMMFVGLLAKLFKEERKFFPWMMNHGVGQGRFGLEFTGGAGVLRDIHRDIFPLHGARLRIAELGDEFPETQIAAEVYDTNGAADEINRVYQDMAEELARLDEKEKKDRAAAELVIRLRARQRAELLKIPAAADMAKDAVEEGLSVAMFVNFNDSADALMARLKTGCCIRGGQTEDERQAAIDAFQADREPVIVCNIKAGGVGVSLHGSPTARRRLAVIMPTDSGQDLKQAFGRVWRAKGAKSLQRVFFAAGTVEEAVCANVRAKIDRIDLLNDGDLLVGPKPDWRTEERDGATDGPTN